MDFLIFVKLQTFMGNYKWKVVKKTTTLPKKKTHMIKSGLGFRVYINVDTTYRKPAYVSPLLPTTSFISFLQFSISNISSCLLEKSITSSWRVARVAQWAFSFPSRILFF